MTVCKHKGENLKSYNYIKKYLVYSTVLIIETAWFESYNYETPALSSV